MSANIPQIIQNLFYQTQLHLEEFKTIKQFESYTDGLILNTIQSNPQFLSAKDDLIAQWSHAIRDQIAYWEKELMMSKQAILVTIAQGYLHAVGLGPGEDVSIQAMQNSVINHLKLHSLNSVQSSQQSATNQTQQQQQLMVLPLETLISASSLSYRMTIEECYVRLPVPTFMKQKVRTLEEEIRNTFAPIHDAIRQCVHEILDYIRRNVLFSFLSPEFLGAQYEAPTSVAQFPSDLNAIISILNYGNTKYGVNFYTAETIMFKKIFAALDLFNRLMQLHGFPGDAQWVQCARSLPPEFGQITVDLVTLAYGLRKTIVPKNKYLDIQMEVCQGVTFPLDYNAVKTTLDTIVNGSNVIQPYTRYNAGPRHVWVSAISNGVEIPRLADILSSMVPKPTPVNSNNNNNGSNGGAASSTSPAPSPITDINGVVLTSVDILNPHFVAIALPPNMAQNPDETVSKLIYHIVTECHEAPLSYFYCPRPDQGADIVFCMPSRRSQQQLLSVQVTVDAANLAFAPCPTYSVTIANKDRRLFPGSILWFLLGFCAGHPIVAVDLADMGTIRITLLPALSQQPHFMEAGHTALHKYGIVATLYESKDEEDDGDGTSTASGMGPSMMMAATPRAIPDVVMDAVANGTSKITRVEEGFSVLQGLAWDPARWRRLSERVQKLESRYRCMANVLVATTTYLYMMSVQRYIDQIRPPPSASAQGSIAGFGKKSWERIPRPDVLVGSSECIHFMDGGNGNSNHNHDGNDNGGNNGNSNGGNNGGKCVCNMAPRYEHTVVSVVNQESLDTARQLKAENPKKRVAVLNMANPTHPGGNWMGGFMAQEESIFLRSSLMLALDPLEYPLDDYDCYYSRDVTVFRDNAKSGYAFLPLKSQWKIDVASVCAVSIARGGEPFGPKHRVYTGIKLFALFNALVRNGVDTVVLGAFGCGVLHNPPNEIAEIFKDLITFYAGHFDKIYFAIMDTNGEKINAFVNALLEPKSKTELSTCTRPITSITASNVLTRKYPALRHPLPIPVDLKTAPQVCPNGGFCTNFSEEHFAEFAHPPPCPAGPGCTITTPWHCAIFWHTKPCPRGMGCKLAGVPENDPGALERHARFFTHLPYCPEGGLCADSSDAHVLAFMHPPFCDEFLLFGSCSKANDAEHLKSLRHYKPTPTIQSAYTTFSQ